MSSLFVCGDCDKTFTRKSNLKRHAEEIHAADGVEVLKHPCSYPGCTKAFKRKHDRDVHETSIHGAFVCAQRACVGRFMTLDQLNQHVTSAHPTTSTSLSSSSSSSSSNRSRKRLSSAAPDSRRPVKQLVNSSTERSFTITQLIDAANNNMLVLHGDHVDAIVQGVLVGIEEQGNNQLVAVEHPLSAHTGSCVSNTSRDAQNSSASTTSTQQQVIQLPPAPHASTTKATQFDESCLQNNCKLPLTSSDEDAHDDEEKAEHRHSDDCGHVSVFHGSHTDYLIGHDVYCPVSDSVAGHLTLVQKSDLFNSTKVDTNEVNNWLELFAANNTTTNNTQ